MVNLLKISVAIGEQKMYRDHLGKIILCNYDVVADFVEYRMNTIVNIRWSLLFEDWLSFLRIIKSIGKQTVSFCVEIVYIVL